MRWYGILLLFGALSVSITAVEPQPRGNRMNTENSKTADSLLSEADSLFKSGDYEKAGKVYQAAMETAQAEFNRSVEVEALAQIARVSLKTGRKEKGREHLNRAGELASESDPMGYSRYLGVRGRFEWQDENLDAARRTFDSMYVYCNTNGLFSRAVDAAHMIAIVASDPAEQVEWGKRGIEAAEAGGAEDWLGPLWNNLAGTYYDLKQYDSALECYIKARDYHWRFSSETAKLFADYHVGMAYRLTGNLDQAENWLRPVLAWAERMQNHSAIGQACEDLGEIQITRGNKDEGLALLRRAESAYRAAGFAESWPELIDNLAIRIKQLED